MATSKTQHDQAQQNLCISLSDDSKQVRRNRIYHPGDLLTGHIRLPVAGSLSICNVLVSFEGITRTWVEHEHYISAVQHEFLKQSLHISNHGAAIQNTDEDECCHTMPFKFRIASQCFPNDDLGSQLSLLPPSFESGEASLDRQRNRCMQPLIMYSIRATAIYCARPGDRLQKLQGSRSIPFTPWTEARPPLSLDDFPGEFKLVSTNDMRKRLLRTHIGRLKISTCEPRPLPLFSDRSTGCTKGVIQLTATLCTDTGRLQPPRLACEVHLELIRHTYFSTLPMKEVASTRLMQSNKFLRLRKTIVHSESWVVDPLCWDQRNIRHSTNISSFEASIPFTINPKAALVPTFATPLATVRYSIKIEIGISQVVHSPLVVEIPLQVYCCRRAEDISSVPSSLMPVTPDGSENMSPPSYYV